MTDLGLIAVHVAHTPAFVGGVEGLLAEADGPLGYVLVFVLAAIPWFEILLVIPVAIALGMNPVAVGLLAFLGNALPIYGIVAFHRRITAWLDRRRMSADEQSSRTERARRIWDRYGLPGLALAGPIATGIHLAAVIALALGGSGRRVSAWMTVSLALWTVVLVAASAMGASLLGFG